MCNKASFKVNVPASEGTATVKYRIKVIDNGNHGYDATLRDSDSLNYLHLSLPNTNGNSTDGTFTATLTRNLEFTVCARPSLSTEVPNTVNIEFSLYECDGVTISSVSQFYIQDSSE